jgi:ABC-type spermidine/putrescine transport system permease subunit I
MWPWPRADPLLTSVVIRTYAWAALFQRRGLVNDLLIQMGIVDEPVKFIYNNTGVLIGMVQILLPFMILPLLNAMRRMDMTLIRAAAILGANPLRVFIHVYLPLSMPGVTAGVLLVFISAVGFYVTPAVLGGPRQMMIAVLMIVCPPPASMAAGLGLGDHPAAATTVLYPSVSGHPAPVARSARVWVRAAIAG